jgi:aryl-alcohol dehydrogenase-like predicted oxidoreductase
MITSLGGRSVSPLGLAAGPKQEAGCVPRAFDGGINYFFFYGPGNAQFIEQLAVLMRAHRDAVIVATGSGARKSKSLLNVRKKLLARLKTEVIDVFFAEYINPQDDLELIFGDGGVLDQLQEWKARQWIRYVGATTHDRTLARRLAQDPRIDLLMHRFNMAHRKAVPEVFPAAIESQTPVIAFTATRWGTLLQAPPDWPGEPPTATDCYRYCLAQPAVHIVLSAPRDEVELTQNLQVLKSPRMSDRDCARWERYGNLFYKQRSDAFETRWPDLF